VLQRGRGATEDGRGGGAPSYAWWPHPDTCRPLRHIAEHVASDEMSKVGRRFGLVIGRFRPRAQNEV
jgi:hypothetical protein